MSIEFLAGQSYPLGATVYESRGVNFCVYSKNAKSMELLLFNSADDGTPSHVIRLHPNRNHRTAHYWHVFVPHLRAGQIYGYRVDGDYKPEQGLRYDYHHS